jgi:arylsulfatase A-like enzyme
MTILEEPMKPATSRLRCLALAGASAIALASSVQAQEAGTPNILLIVADDLGYSDIGPYGSEIRTPNLEALADGGMVLTNFHAAWVCNVTRLQLMTGIDNNIATDPEGATAATRTALRHDTLTMAEALDAAGYRSYYSGKWDLGQREDQTPHARGFDRSFALLPGTASHYDEEHLPKRQPVYWEYDQHVTDIPDDFYSTRFYTDKLLEFLTEDEGSDEPFFAFLSYTAPHFPVQAPVEYTEKYAGVYDEGYEAVHDRRVLGMKAKGLLSDDFAASPFPADAIPWDGWPSSEERKLDARRMQVYAGMIDYMDEQIGRVISYLDQTGELDDTLIIFTSDNGATPGWEPPVFVDYGTGGPDNSIGNLGLPGSYMTPGNGWAWVSGAPFNGYKEGPLEGGHSVPAIAFMPGRIPAGANSDAFLNVRDLLPTFLDVAGSELPSVSPSGQPTVALDGRSALPLLLGETDVSPYAGDVVAFHSGEVRYLYKDEWKILKNGDDGWQLYNMATDRIESRDLADENPEKLAELLADWQEHERRVEENVLK